MSNNVMSLIKQVGEIFVITASNRNKLQMYPSFQSKVAVSITIMEKHRSPIKASDINRFTSRLILLNLMDLQNNMDYV